MSTELLVITPENIQRALDALTWVTQNYEFNALESLQIVEDLVVSEELTFTNTPRRFALNEILTSNITQLYCSYRQSLGLTTAFVDQSDMVDTISIINEDVSTEIARLIGFSWIYFHYVKTSMSLSQKKFSELTKINSRTIRRYQKVAIEHLADYIAKLELIARKDKRKSRLTTKLPHKGRKIDLWGRNRELEVIKMYGNQFHIIGAHGIGKTSLIEYVVSELINNEEVDQLIWLDSPASVEFVRNSIYEQFTVESIPIHLENLMQLQRFVIVFDNCELLFRDIPSLNNLLNELNSAQVFLTTSFFISPILECKQILLEELELSAIEKLILQENIGYEQSLDLASQVQKIIGGNPAAIKLFLKYHDLYTFDVSRNFVMEKLFTNVFMQLTTSMRLAWLLVSICRDNQLTFSLLAGLSRPHLAFNDFTSLIQRRIVFDTDGTLSMTRLARQFIQWNYLNHSILQNELVRFMISIEELRDHSEHICLVVVEAVLSTEWITLSDDLVRYIIDLVWQTGMRHGRYAQWYALLSNFSGNLSQENIPIVIGYAICSRYLGRFEQSNQILKSIIENTGLNGQFELQASALLELCVLLRYRSNYDEVLKVLQSLKTLLPTLDSDELWQRLLVEEIEYAIDISAWELAQEKLFLLPDELPRRLLMQLEVMAHFEPESISTSYLEDCIRGLTEDYGKSMNWMPQGHVLVARILEKQEDINGAVRHFSSALLILEQQDNDPFSLARTQSNLAAALLMLDQISEAGGLIDAAIRTQRIIGDHRGLAVTMHNSRLLARKIVS